VRQSTTKLVLTGLLIASAWVAGIAAAKETAPAVSDVTIPLSRLPAEGRDTYQLILRGGPFPYEKDGTVFGNRERLLPLKTRGYYREYTVPTPGLRNRGAKRIVCGGKPKVPDACFYTADHYASFRRIVP
jgi:ribonuclease T1